MMMTSDELKKRTKNIAIDAIHLVDSLSSDRTSNMLGNQLMRVATSAATNYLRHAGHAPKLISFQKLQLSKKNLMNANIGLNCSLRQENLILSQLKHY
jgi:hypothetical protein